MPVKVKLGFESRFVWPKSPCLVVKAGAKEDGEMNQTQCLPSRSWQWTMEVKTDVHQWCKYSRKGSWFRGRTSNLGWGALWRKFYVEDAASEVNLEVRIRIYASLGSQEADSQTVIMVQGCIIKCSWGPHCRRKGGRQDSGNLQERPQMTPWGALRLGWPFWVVLGCGEETRPLYPHVAPGRACGLG